MPSSIVKGLNVGNPVGTSSEHFNIGAEAQNIVVSYDANGHVIEDITGQTVASTKTLSNLLKGSAGNYIGTCPTGASVAAKVVTVASDYNFELKPGVIIGISFTNTNIAADPTINVNNTGAKSIFKGNAVQTSGDAGIMGGYMNFFQYDGTYWCWISSGLAGGGGGGTTYNIIGAFVDTNNVIRAYTEFFSSMTYTATEDCYVALYAVSQADGVSVMIDNVLMYETYDNAIAGDGNIIPLKQGQTLSVSGASSQHESYYTVYGITPGTGGGGAGGGHIIQNNAGTSMPQKDALQFKSATVTDATGKTVVEIAPVMTGAQYEALSQDQKMDGTVRFISDGLATLKTFGVEQALSSGVEIGSIIINGARTRLYAPDIDNLVQVTPTLQTGTEIGTITIDGVDYKLYGPRAVSVDRVLNSGVEIGGITVGGSRTALYAPDSGVWSSTVQCAVGATSCTIIFDAINVNNDISVDVYYQKSGSNVVYIKTQTVTQGKVVITFDALTEQTSFRAKVSRVS